MSASETAARGGFALGRGVVEADLASELVQPARAVAAEIEDERGIDRIERRHAIAPCGQVVAMERIAAVVRIDPLDAGEGFDVRAE